MSKNSFKNAVAKAKVMCYPCDSTKDGKVTKFRLVNKSRTWGKIVTNGLSV